MTRDQITVGVMLRVIAARWDRPVGTIGKVTETGTLFIDDTWWFAVEWLTYLPKRPLRSLRLFEEDTVSFELLTGPIVIPLPMTPRQMRDVRKAVPAQASLFFTRDDDDE